MSVVALLLNRTSANQQMEGTPTATVRPSHGRNWSHQPTARGKDTTTPMINNTSPVPNGRTSPHRPKASRESAENSLNFKTVQRIDRDVNEIVLTVAKVVVYEYHQPNDTWERTSVEGTLFVYSRSTHPAYGLMVLNRLSSENFVQHITPDLPIHIQPPFVLFSRQSSSQVHGLCLSEESLCQQVGQLLKSLSHQRKADTSESLYQEPSQHSPPDSAEQQGFLRVEQMSPSLNNHASSSQEGSLYVPHSPPLPSSHPPVHMPPSLSGIDWKREQAKQHRTSVPRRSSEPVAAAGKSVPMRSASPKLAIQGNRTVPKSGGVQASSRSKRSHKTGSQSQVRGDSITQSSTVHCSTATTSSPSLARKLFHSNTLDSDTSTNSSKSQKEDQPTEATAPILKSLFAQVSSAQSSTEGEPHPLPAISAADLERQMHMEVPSPDGQTGVDFKYAGEAPTERNMCVPISISVLTDKSSVQPQLLQPSAFSAQLSASEQTGLVVSKTSGAEVNVVVQPPTPLASEPTQPVFSSGSDSSQTLRSLVQIFPSIPPLVHSPGMTAAPKSSSKHTVECPVSRVPEGNSEQAEHRMASPSSGGDCNNNSRAVSPELLAPHRAVQASPAVGLMSPMQFTSMPKKSQTEPADMGRDEAHTLSTRTQTTGDPNKVVGLTKSQMQQALVYLITHDESFMDTLHRAYIASLSPSNPS